MWFFRSVESEDGSWSCRRGRLAMDEHPTLAESLEHLREIARPHGHARLVAHWLDGTVEWVGEVGA